MAGQQDQKSATRWHRGATATVSLMSRIKQVKFDHKASEHSPKTAVCLVSLASRRVPWRLCRAVCFCQGDMKLCGLWSYDHMHQIFQILRHFLHLCPDSGTILKFLNVLPKLTLPFFVAYFYFLTLMLFALCLPRRWKPKNVAKDPRFLCFVFFLSFASDFDICAVVQGIVNLFSSIVLHYRNRALSLFFNKLSSSWNLVNLSVNVQNLLY